MISKQKQNVIKASCEEDGCQRKINLKPRRKPALNDRNELHQNRPKSRTSSILQRREKVRERLASIIVIGFVIIYIALIIKALVMTTSSSEFLNIIESLLPYLLVALSSILPYYFGQRKSDDRDDNDVSGP